MRQGPKSDSRDPRVKVPAGLPTDENIRRPLVGAINGITKAATVLLMIFFAGASFALGVAAVMGYFKGWLQ